MTDELSFAEKFQLLVDVARKPDGTPYSDKELAEMTGLTKMYIWQLRTGRRGEPRNSNLRKIAQALRVDPDYFSSEEAFNAVHQPSGATQPTDESAAPDESDEPFAIKLRRLFASVKREDGSDYTPVELAESIGVSAAEVQDLLAGTLQPGGDHLPVKIAEFFAAQPEYFRNTVRGRDLNRQYELLARLGEQNVRQIATRASRLPPDKLRDVLAYLDFQAGQGQGPDENSSE
ncbi:helix-turn-helix transcriptional regulator [Amycolatopsis rhizosphaerae]|uniref:Helix-turn-helix transcriptional regulator n=1 Tax=Amycolatopsis rhizosphaerae TaxID=2053003 RepID=A0A558DLS3_9PSEU|nr:helix-turn-helix domain-containing protein [Amycolatopsis rhizosphaerae]TVT61965.1 helix-turn-helix transcriptional regulator [Amycolatopsis rhizosphaerae]